MKWEGVRDVINILIIINYCSIVGLLLIIYNSCELNYIMVGNI